MVYNEGRPSHYVSIAAEEVHSNESALDGQVSRCDVQVLSLLAMPL